MAITPVFLLAVSVFTANPSQVSVEHGKYIPYSIVDKTYHFSGEETCEIYADKLYQTLEDDSVLYYDVIAECVELK